MATTYAVDLKFGAQTRELDASVAKLNNVERAAKQLQGTVNNTKLDALTGALNALPGGASAAANGVLGFTNRVKDLRVQSKAAAAEVAALQVLLKRQISQKRIELGAKGGIGGEALKREIAGLESQLASTAGSSAIAARGMAAGLTLAAGAVVAVGAAATAVAVPMIRFNNVIETNRKQLTLFTKDAAVTDGIIKSLKKTADETSLGLPGLLEATATLSAYGVEAKYAGTATKLLGDIAKGDNEKLQRFAVNLGQIAGLGRAYTVDLKQFSMAGVPIFDALAKATGKSTAEIMRMAEEGRITYPLVVKALLDMTEQGEAFYDGAKNGSTELSRSLAQMQGAWETISQKIGAALTPAVVAAINGITDALDGLVGILDRVGNAASAVANGPAGQFASAWINALGSIVNFFKENPVLASIIPGVGAPAALNFSLQKIGRDDRKASGSSAGKEEADRKAYQQRTELQARKNAEDEYSKLQIQLEEKVTQLRKTEAYSLFDARIGYERQIADFRASQIDRIADLERQISDERRRAEFDAAQLREKNLSSKRLSGLDLQIADAQFQGKDTRELEAARKAEEYRTDRAQRRAEIEFNATQRRIEIERRLTDFKRETERQLGQMQLAFTRQTSDILTTAGRSLKDLMIEGAKAAKAIFESVDFSGSAAAAGSGLTGGKPQSGGAFGKWDPALLRATGQLDQKYKVPLGTTASLVMFESSGNTRAQGPNVPGQGRGHGLFQVMPGTARGLGVNHQGILGMGGVEQIGLLDKYLASRGFKPGMNAGQMYATVLGGNPWARGADMNGTTPGSGAAAQRGMRSSAAQAVQGAMGGASSVARPFGQKATLNGKHVIWDGKQWIPDPTAPTAANNIVSTTPGLSAPGGSVPFTSPALEAADKGLRDAEAKGVQERLLQAQLEGTARLFDGYKEITSELQSQLVSSQKRNELDQRALEMMRDGVKPELAEQLAANEQLVAATQGRLETQKGLVEDALKEKDITAETRAERQKLLDLINSQLTKMPELSSMLNAEAQQTQGIRDARAQADQAKSDAQSISGSITSGMKDAIKAAITGGDVKAALSNMLGSLGDRLLDIAFRPLEQMLTQGLTNMLTPAANQQVQAAFIMQTASTKMITAANTYAASMAAGGAGGGFSPLSLIGPLLGVAGAGFGGGAFGSGFNPLSTTKLFPGGIFEGGGYTGNAPRAGGMDGKGGFPAILHPGETVTDHRSSAARSALNGGGSGGGAPSMTLNVTATQIADDRWVKVDDLDAAMSKAARQGAAMGERRTLDRLRQSPKTRRSLGI